MKKQKVNSRWRKGAVRYPGTDERAKTLLPKCREEPGWFRGARVVKR